MQTIRTNTIPSVDRPDIAKTEAKQCLSFKEVKDSLFKFLLQAEIPFTEPEKVNLITEFKSKSDVSFSFSTTYYTSTCRLLDITVDKKPVYIIVIPERYSEVDSRQANKLIALRKQHKIVVFDSDDWREIGLDISGKQWLRPLSRGTLKLWARKLFHKISLLGKEVESKFTLNDLYEAIDRNTSSQTKSLLNTLMEQNLDLKRRLRMFVISQYFDLKPSHFEIVKSLSELNSASTLWAEEVITYVTDFAKGIDWRKSNTKDFFRTKTGKVVPSDKEKLSEYLVVELSRKKPNLAFTNFGRGLIQIQNKKTFQVVNILVNPTTSIKSAPIELDQAKVSKLQGRLVFVLNLQFAATSPKIGEVSGEVLLLSHYSTPFRYGKEHRLPVYDSTQHKTFKLWLPDE